MANSIQESSYEYGFSHFVGNAIVMSFVCVILGKTSEHKNLHSTVLCSTTDAVTKQNLYTNFYRCTVHSDIHTVHSPTDAHLLKL